VDKPKLVFFFDEAHLLFSEAPPALLEKVEQVVRLIRSKGVGIYFVTQNPLDVPDRVLGQLGNRVQHALRAFTPRDQKALQTAAETMRANPAFDAATAIAELGTGEALVSFLDAKGRPAMVERALILPPASRLGPLTAPERQAAITASPLQGRYEEAVDRESAYERLKGRAAAATAPAPARQEPAASRPLPAETAPMATSGNGLFDGLGDLLGGGASGGGRRREGIVEAAVKSAARQIGSQVGREIIRGVLGSILGGRR
jgi:DNA helicase HerA-like ATPase